MTKKPIFIAEVGVNHDGSIQKAMQLIDAAKEAGAIIVKFQTFVAERVVTSSAKMAEYQKNNLGTDTSQLEMLKKLELTYDEFRKLKSYSDQQGIEFLSSGFDLESLEFLATLKPSCWKIPSGELTNLPYLEFIGKQNGAIFLSTGMATMAEVITAHDVLSKIRGTSDQIYVMHCTTQYPASFEDINLNVLRSYKSQFGPQIGYSDHSLGIEISLAALALGAVVIEKHITLNTQDPGPDHKASITPTDFAAMTRLGSNIFLALGSDEKMPSPIEIKNKDIVRRSIVAKKNIQRGDIFDVSNLDVKRPGTGMSPMKWHLLMGKKASRDYRPDELIDEANI